MSDENGTGDIFTALGVPMVDVWYPCGACEHAIELHVVGQCAESQARFANGAVGPCPCNGFIGGYPDGTPRGVRLRQLANHEWSSFLDERGLPTGLPVLQADSPSPSRTEREETHRWACRLVQATLQAVRVWDAGLGKTRWQGVRVLDTGATADNGKWEITLDQLDRLGSGLVDECAARLVHDLNEGAGAFTGVVRKFRGPRTGDVSPASSELREGAARVGMEPAGSAG